MENTQVLLNIVWTMVGAFLVYFMQAGFAMVETGFTRAKNSGNILMKNMMDFVLGDCIRCYGRENQIHLLFDLLRSHQRFHLSDHRTLDLGRRLVKPDRVP